MVKAVLGDIHLTHEITEGGKTKSDFNRRVNFLLRTHSDLIVTAGSRIVQQHNQKGVEFYIAIPRKVIRESHGIPLALRGRIGGIAIDILD